MGFVFEPNPSNAHRTGAWGAVALLAPGVTVHLRATRPEFRCEHDGALTARLRTQRRKLGLTIDPVAPCVEVRRWTWGLWESCLQRPQKRYRTAVEAFLVRQS